MDENSTKLNEDFQWSGHVFFYLLEYLKENKGIDLLQSEFESVADWISETRDAQVMIFTMNHKKSYLKKMEKNNFRETNLIAFNKDWLKDENPELVKAEMGGIEAIRNSLAQLKNENEIVLLTVG